MLIRPKLHRKYSLPYARTRSREHLDTSEESGHPIQLGHAYFRQTRTTPDPQRLVYTTARLGSPLTLPRKTRTHHRHTRTPPPTTRQGNQRTHAKHRYHPWPSNMERKPNLEPGDTTLPSRKRATVPPVVCNIRPLPSPTQLAERSTYRTATTTYPRRPSHCRVTRKAPTHPHHSPTGRRNGTACSRDCHHPCIRHHMHRRWMVTTSPRQRRKKKGYCRCQHTLQQPCITSSKPTIPSHHGCCQAESTDICQPDTSAKSEHALCQQSGRYTLCATDSPPPPTRHAKTSSPSDKPSGTPVSRPPPDTPRTTQQASAQSFPQRMWLHRKKGTLFR